MPKNEERSVTITAAIRDKLTAGLKRVREALGAVDSSSQKTARSGTLLGRAFRAIRAGADRLAHGLRRLTHGFAGFIRSIGRAISRLNPLTALLGGLGAALVARKLADWSDQWVLVGNRLRLVTKNASNLLDVQKELFKIAQDTRTPLKDTVDLYYRIARQGEKIGLSQQRALALTRTISQATKIGGGSQEGVNAALLQFGQIISSPQIASAAQELNSLREQTPALFNAILEGFAKMRGLTSLTRKDLLQMIADGKVSALDLLNAIQSQAGKLDDEFSKLQMTIGQSFIKLGNSVARFVGILSGATGAGASFAGMISDLAEKIDALTQKMRPFALAVATLWGGKGGNLKVPGLNITIGDEVKRELKTFARTVLDTLVGTLKGAGVLLMESFIFLAGRVKKLFTDLAAQIGHAVYHAFVKAMALLPGTEGGAFRKILDIEKQNAALDKSWAALKSKIQGAADAVKQFSVVSNFIRNSRGLAIIRKGWSELSTTAQRGAESLVRMGNQITDATQKASEGVSKVGDAAAPAQEKTDGFFDGLRNGIANAVNGFNRLYDVGKSVGDSLGKALTDGISGALVDIASRAKSAADAFRDWAGSLLQDIARVILKFSILRALQSTPGLGFLGFSAAGASVAANAGGLIPGRGPDRDSVTAALTPGEYVVRRSAADYYGPILDAINQRLIPRSAFASVPNVASPTQAVRQAFNQGGPVRADGDGTSVLPVMVTDSAGVERLFSEGRQGLLRVMRSHASEFRAAIGH